jgi:hypothetical protein
LTDKKDYERDIHGHGMNTYRFLLHGFHAPNHVCGKCKWKIHVEKREENTYKKIQKQFCEGKKERKKEFAP